MNKVLDKGYVRLVDWMGDDLKPVNAARVSFDRESHELSKDDERLIGFLANHDHTSPFRHALLQFECYAPLMVCRQWWKYIIGSGHKKFEGGLQDPFTAWNESSRRYITEEPEFYIIEPNQWRSAPENRKQGSGEVIPLDKGNKWTQILIESYRRGIKDYENAMKDGICAEQARVFLPAYALYVRWYWTASLQGVCHLINQRLANDAQKEFQLFANEVMELTQDKFPIATKELVKV